MIATSGAEIVTLTLAGDTDLNLITGETLAELDGALARLEGEPALKVLVLTGAGQRAFSAGADLRLLAGGLAEPAAVRAFVELGGRVFDRLERFPLPVLAAINGHCLGAAFELVLACDLRVLAASARFGQPAVSLGLVPPFGGSVRLPRLVGETRAKELWFGAAPLPPEQALAWGLVNRVAPAEEFAAAVAALAERMAAHSRHALRAAKEVWLAGLDGGRAGALAAEAAALCEALLHPQTGEGMRRRLRDDPGTA